MRRFFVISGGLDGFYEGCFVDESSWGISHDTSLWQLDEHSLDAAEGGKYPSFGGSSFGLPSPFYQTRDSSLPSTIPEEGEAPKQTPEKLSADSASKNPPPRQP